MITRAVAFRSVVVCVLFVCIAWYFSGWREWDSREKCAAQIYRGVPLTACDELTPTQRESAQTLVDWGYFNYTDETRPEWMH